MAWRNAVKNHPDRQIAATWARRYRKAMAQPDGVLDLDRDKDEADFGLIDAKNPLLLIRLLENFARHGTFRYPDLKFREFFERLNLRREFNELLKQGLTKKEALDVMYQRYEQKDGDRRGYSDVSIQRKLNLRK